MTSPASPSMRRVRRRKNWRLLDPRARIGRTRRYRYTHVSPGADDGEEERDGIVTHVWRLRRGRQALARFVKPARQLLLETVLAGPYTEDYAGYTALFWWRARLQAARRRRGVPLDRLWARLYTPHPLQRGWEE